MPELPDITLYVEHIARRVIGARLERVRVTGPNLLRTTDPSLDRFAGTSTASVHRMGKRIVIAFEGDLFLVLHLMIAGRLHWKDGVAPAPTRTGLASFEWTSGTLLLAEASRRQRASLHAIEGRGALAALDPGGLEVLEADLATFAGRLRREDHTLKRVLTDPRLFSGIGNAYSDEILHHARLSPLQRTRNLDDGEVSRLFDSTRTVLTRWTERLRAACGERFPEGVTAFRDGMAVHGRYRKPCPDCGAPVQRVVYADRETNYCARCQTGGRRLADRLLSRLLRDDWVRSLEDLEG